MIEAFGLTKRYGQKTAVDDLTFTVRPGDRHRLPRAQRRGQVDHDADDPGSGRPAAGTVLVNGKTVPGARRRRFTRWAPCLRRGRSTPAAAPTTTCWRWPRRRASPGPGSRRSSTWSACARSPSKSAGSFSLGMGQRLGIASALLGDPQMLILDEPVNGLDPDGIRWIRNLLKSLAAEGRTVFVSSHLMSEMAQTAEHLIVVGRGKLIADTSVQDFIASSSGNRVRVRTTNPAGLAEILAGPDVGIDADGGDALEVSGLTTDQIGLAAGRAGITLLELSAMQTSLEEAFMDLTTDAVEYHGVTTNDGGSVQSAGAAR